jgi:LacI family transcriptional regulator
MLEVFDAGVQAANHLESLLQQIQAVAAYPSEEVVRISWNDTVTIKRVLDASATSLLFPYARNPEEVHAAVAATRYPLQGVSDVSVTTRGTRFGCIRDCAQHAHEQICLMLEFETRESLEPFEANAEIGGVGGVCVGPADLHASMGLAGESASPAVVPLIEDALRGIRKDCKAPSILTGDEAHWRVAASKPASPSLRLARTSPYLPEVQINWHPGSRARTGGSRRPRMSRRRSGTGPTPLVDVARHAGVSTASVSRAINDRHPVSSALGERVARAARALDWVPGGAAKALASLQWRTVGAVIPSLGNPNFGKLVEALQRELARVHYTLELGFAESRTVELRTQHAREMVERGIDCLILVGEAQPTALIELPRSQGIPCLMAYTTGWNRDTACIGLDNHLAAAQITRHLLGLGHRLFGMGADTSDWNNRVEQRVAGVKVTPAKAGLTIKPQHLAQVDGARRFALGRLGLIETAAGRAHRPTAVICSNDYLAFGVMIKATSRGVAVPDPLSVTGFDDVDLSAHLVPALTTIRIPVDEMGEQTARYIVRVFEHGSAPLPAPLKAECVVRGSTASPTHQLRASVPTRP